MSREETQDQGLARVAEQLCAMDGVGCTTLEDRRLELEICHKGDSRTVLLDILSSDYRLQKIQYGRLRDALSDLGITESRTFVAAAPPQRAITPLMRAARENQKKEFEAWQAVWQSIRKAEKALDVAYEIAQMQSYY